jgi:uncharacterized protein (TIRG00374 family)
MRRRSVTQPPSDEPAAGDAPRRSADRSRRGLLVRAVVFSLFLIFVGWAGTKVNWHAIHDQLTNASLPYIVAMVAAYVVSLFVRPLRLWVLFLGAVPEVRPRYWPAFRADNIAMAINSIVPARAGEVAMAFSLRQSLGISTARSSSLVLVDRFLDFCTVVLIFVISFLMSPGGAAWARVSTTWLGGLVVIFVLGLISAVRLRSLWLFLLGRALARLAPARASRWEGRIRDLFSVLSVLDDPRRMILLMALSAATWAIISLSFWLGLHSVWPDISPAAAAFAASAVTLSFLLPIAPAGIGLYQGAVVLALQLFGVNASPALTFAILAHALQVASILVLAGISLAWQGISGVRDEMRKRHPSHRAGRQ